ncbi:hypothetical protein B9Z55_021967 [Caenorhabditis nigoni]|uniref:Uncharacterized protein n=1 Tax=Caenorhabditis nigoni TaxID=1611254 RepID=A0A2G5TUV5_9PELO|nr:hypothetical protein B9Z55_021967 [Caenorhabditis nigoni]
MIIFNFHRLFYPILITVMDTFLVQFSTHFSLLRELCNRLRRKKKKEESNSLEEKEKGTMMDRKRIFWPL